MNSKQIPNKMLTYQRNDSPLINIARKIDMRMYLLPCTRDQRTEFPKLLKENNSKSLKTHFNAEYR